MSGGPGDPMLHVEALRKSYPGVTALADVSLTLRAGEVHALVGENGAGKSTLGRVICGLAQADGGRMLLRDQSYAPTSRADAERAGVRMVMQELNLIPTLTVAENIFLGRLPRRLGFIRYADLNARAAELLADLGLRDIDPATPVGDLGVGQQQMVEIARALSQPCGVLLLDEPTAALSTRECELLFAQIDRLRAAGAGILYISHRMEEIKRIADRITVLRDGRWIATRDSESISIDEVIRLMVGRELGEASLSHGQAGAVALRVDGLCRGKAVRGVSFEARRGEILGFGGLMGSGRTETMRAIFGADRPDAGHVYLGDSTTPLTISSPRQAIRHGIALLTENRKEQGLFLPLSIAANSTVARLGQVATLGWISSSKEHVAAGGLARSMSLRCRGLDQSVSQLSGGNQQKVVIAKWLFRDCGVLIFDEPTRGIDVGAKFEIYRLLADLAAAGKAIIVVSSDLQELMAISDRIAVMSAGRIAETFERGQWTEDRIMAAALSGYMGDAARAYT